MANVIKTNSLTELVALRAAASAGYFTVGSKAYFSDQLVGKRNGQSYTYVLRDTGNVANSLKMDSTKNDVQERSVVLALEPWNIGVKTNAIEGKTDLIFDKEIAEPNGQKLINGAVAKSIKKDIAKSATAFVGKAGEFEPMAQATGHLSSITPEVLYGFCNPMVEAICTARGAQFVPVDAPAMYKAGLIGHFHGADWRSQRFLNTVKVADGLAALLKGGYATEFKDNKLHVSLNTAATEDIKIAAYTPFWCEGVMACDGVGDPTSEEFAWIASEDVSVASGDVEFDIPVSDTVYALGGTRDVAMEDGSELKFENDGFVITAPEAGVYYIGLVRANGAFEFECLPDLDCSNADTTKGTVEGITVFRNRVIDLDEMTNTTRFDTVTLSGIVDKRYQSLVLVKKA